MCDCRAKIEKQLTDRFKETSPEASKHVVKLEGYTICIGEKLTVKGYMPYKATADFLLKKGGVKAKSTTGHMVFSYCPFCGEKQ